MPVIFNPKKKNGLFYIPSGATKSESAAFSYSQSSYRVDESNPTPTITGDTGGTFTASPEGLSINSSTGEITLSTSTINSYTVTYTLSSGTFENRSLGITAAAFASTKSFSFDGVNDYINCNTGEIGNVDVSTSYWIKTTASGTYVPMWSVGLHAVGSANSSFGRYYFNGSGNLFVAASSNYGTTIINDGNWHHIVETYTASSKTKYIYVDGNTTAEATSSLPGWWNAPTYRFQGLVLGTYTPTNTTYMFEGNLDEVALWTSVLSSAAIIEIHNSGVPKNLDSLSNASAPTYWYRMGE